ncbi:hypothetical protein DID88_004499 [Monilinia fructigena]|uniref:FAD-binding domain-containing protein n=1 Tax=Monilinia fructigena TaxID=38457 RepID=A0A395IS26_9HELO|nr:hypothetical protein DID88_004499 [Monilinia fructigena]
MATQSPHNPQTHILISGASIAGPALAYWLHRASICTTIIERSPSLRSAGQGIDIRGVARAVISRMGLEERIRSKVTHEIGLQFVDQNGEARASFPMEENGNSFTSDIEILRGDLAEDFLREYARDHGVYLDDYVTGLEETDEGVRVTFAKGESKTFDLVVALMLVKYLEMTPEEQKKAWRDEMSDMGWEITRILEGMDEAPDYYMQEIAQVNPPQFSKGRITLVGDAGYCPSPISGMGTSSAILGAYYLAGELGACKGDWGEGLKNYEGRIEAGDERVQKLPPGARGS